jgi:hypothetical protein
MKATPTGRFTLAAILLVLLLLGGSARADGHPIATLVPRHVLLVRGFSVRSGDWFVLDPSFWIARDLVGPRRPIMLVARPMLGVGGAGAGIGIAPTLEPPCPDAEACTPTPFFWLPISLEAHVERMYGPTPWRRATYVGPTLSFSPYIFKASVGWMVDASDHADRHVQIAIGGGF